MAIGVSYSFLKRAVSGLMFLQISFVFNTAIILFGWATGAVSLFRVAHFFLYQWTAVLGLYWVYRSILRNRAGIFERLHHLNVAKISALLVSFNLVLFGFFLCLVVRNEGASRIEFMTASWFSFFRPVLSILAPLGFFFPLYLLDRGYRLLPLLILASSVICNVASGSKASFVFGVICALLLYRDLKGTKLAVPKWLVFAVMTGLTLSAVFALARLNVGAADLAARFVRFGESTIMVYYSDDPSAAASGVSTLAKIHRGVAKALGDRSAADIDTLFGFALSTAVYGGHNFTGPNAQIPSYMFCNYSGWENLIGFGSIVGYLLMIAFFIQRIVLRGAEKVMLIPFVVSSLNTFAQDYYQGMSDLTLLWILMALLAGMEFVTLACRDAMKERRAWPSLALRS